MWGQERKQAAVTATGHLPHACLQLGFHIHYLTCLSQKPCTHFKTELSFRKTNWFTKAFQSEAPQTGFEPWLSSCKPLPSPSFLSPVLNTLWIEWPPKSLQYAIPIFHSQWHSQSDSFALNQDSALNRNAEKTLRTSPTAPYFQRGHLCRSSTGQSREIAHRTSYFYPVSLLLETVPGHVKLYFL